MVCFTPWKYKYKTQVHTIQQVLHMAGSLIPCTGDCKLELESSSTWLSSVVNQLWNVSRSTSCTPVSAGRTFATWILTITTATKAHIKPPPQQHTRYTFISLHGIAMPKGIYFTAVDFSFFLPFFLTRNLWGHWTDLNRTWTHIHLWLLFKKIGPNSPGHLYPQAGGKKKLLWDRLWTLT